MVPDVLAGLTWRDALFALVALLAVYVIVVFLRWHRLRRGSPSAEAAPPATTLSALAAYAAEQAAPADNVNEPELLSAPSETAFPWNEPPPEIPGQERIEALEREITQLRKEVAGLRAEVLVLREEKQREVDQARSAPRVSPLYNDAMQMATQGYDATSISEHCGIARAEAELVVALVRNRNN